MPSWCLTCVFSVSVDRDTKATVKYVEVSQTTDLSCAVDLGFYADRWSLIFSCGGMLNNYRDVRCVLLEVGHTLHIFSCDLFFAAFLMHHLCIPIFFFK